MSGLQMRVEGCLGLDLCYIEVRKFTAIVPCLLKLPSEFYVGIFFLAFGRFALLLLIAGIIVQTRNMSALVIFGVVQFSFC